ncbi:MAG: 6-carboxy-5,6,7,8-tetrahydropterin synthase [Fimbriimonadales bacterium]|nr:MAG: 6-carboxy-5,6,7,8-tetrahydropterin synthase [Fimbriimonadales bacterium]
MKASKRFRWEAAHRLPWHTGGCQNLHGHSYEMWVELEGTPDDRGMLIDFKDIKKVMGPLVEAWDHAVLVADYDAELKQAIEILGSKHFVFPYDTTSENMCRYVADYLGHEALDVLLSHNISSIRVKVLETETCFAELEVAVAAYLTNGKVTSAVATER